MKCTKCEAEATFIHPEIWCDLHWCEWWVNLNEDPEGRKADLEEALADIKALDEEECFLQEMINERTLKDPEFPKLVTDAICRRADKVVLERDTAIRLLRGVLQGSDRCVKEAYEFLADHPEIEEQLIKS